VSDRPKIPVDLLSAAADRGFKLEVDWACNASPGFRRKVCKIESGASKGETAGSDYYNRREQSCLSCKQSHKFVLKVRHLHARPSIHPFHEKDKNWFFDNFYKCNFASNPMQRLKTSFEQAVRQADIEQEMSDALTEDYERDVAGRVEAKMIGRQTIDYGRSNCL
jgi:hypothetical protein